jgi:hypothetical protein
MKQLVITKKTFTVEDIEESDVYGLVNKANRKRFIIKRTNGDENDTNRETSCLVIIREDANVVTNRIDAISLNINDKIEQYEVFLFESGENPINWLNKKS